jgi:hypothetical protein
MSNISVDMGIAENIFIPVILRRILTSLLSPAYFDISFDTVYICSLVASMDSIDVFMIILSTGVTSEENDLSYSILDLLNISVKSV